MKKILTASLICAILGLTLCIFGLIAINFNFNRLNNKGEPVVYEKSYNCADFENIFFDIPYGKVEFIVKKDIQDLNLRIETYEKDKWNYQIVNNVLIVENNNDGFYYHWWNIFQNWNNDAKIYVQIPENIFLNRIDLNLSAGEMILNDIVFNELHTKVSAGKLTLNNVNGNILEAKNSAGKTSVNGTIKIINAKVSAGELSFTSITFDKLKFDVSAGNLNASINGLKEDYNIDVEVSAGSCNVTNQITTSSKSISGKVSAGNAHLIFNS